MHATDTDIGSNGAVRYRIRHDPLGDHKSFSVDRISGVVKVAKPLDRERQKLYELRIEAYDLGVPTPLSSDLDLTIYISNINDNNPQFLIDDFHVNFTEHRSPGLERAAVVSTVDGDEDDIYGEPSDQTGVCYFIVGGDDTENVFALHPTLHQLMTTKELDREQKSDYTLVVRATDRCHTFLSSPGLSEKRANVVFDPSDDSLLRILVNVVDIDDNPPVFSRKIFTSGISTDNDYGSVITTVHAFDVDEGDNADIIYSVYDGIRASELSEGLEGITDPFMLNQTSGDIILNFDPQDGMKGHFEFVVTARDRSKHIDAAKVQIYLIREDQRVKFVMRSHPAEIRARIDDFRSVLSNVTDAIVNVDEFKVHEGDKTKTDVYLHFVDYRDNSVMEVRDVLKLIDMRTEELDPVFREFNVLHTEGASPVQALRAGQFATTETVVILWLAGLCAFLFALLVLVTGLWLHQRSKYVRKLRAATCGQTPTTQLPSRPNDTVPNTNKHAIEGSNPVWMTGVAYENMTFDPEEELEEEDLDDNVFKPEANLDSLDVNVLNLDADRSGTVKVGSAITGMMLQKQEPRARSRSSESSGRGSGTSNQMMLNFKQAEYMNSIKNSTNSSRRVHTSNNRTIYDRNLSIDSMFPPQMPPVEDKLGFEGSHSSIQLRHGSNSAGSTARTRRGVTTYENGSIPRTELWYLEIYIFFRRSNSIFLVSSPSRKPPPLCFL